MSVTTSSFVLFLHIALVVVGLSLAAVLHTGVLLMRSADQVAAIRAWPRVIAAVEPALPLIALLILGTGAWLLHLSDGEFGWRQGWVVASLCGLAVAEAAGAAVAPRSARLRREVSAAPDGPLAPDLRRRTHDPVLWLVLHGATSLFLGVIFLMVVKPSGAWSAVIIAAVGVIGAASGLPFARMPAPRAIDVTDPAELWPQPRS